MRHPVCIRVSARRVHRIFNRLTIKIVFVLYGISGDLAALYRPKRVRRWRKRSDRWAFRVRTSKENKRGTLQDPVHYTGTVD